MKQQNRPTFSHTRLALYVSALFVSGMAVSYVRAETITYDGSDPSMLRPDPWGKTGSLFPDNSITPAGSIPGNMVYVIGGAISGHVYGGAKQGTGIIDIGYNTVTISDGSISGRVYGGHADSKNDTATAHHNTVSISGGSISSTVYGGAAGFINNSGATIAIASTNTVNISGGSFLWIYGGRAESSNTATANHNTVSISDGTFSNTVYAGVSKATSSSGIATASYNTTNVSGGSISGWVYGGRAESSGTATANHNTVTISGGSISNPVYGGVAESSGTAATASYNTVTISSGLVSGNVTGGHANSGSGTTIAVNHNTVILLGNPVFGTATQLLGGNVSGGATGDSFTGNRLVVQNPLVSPVSKIANFQHMELTIAAGAPAITAGTLTLGDTTHGATTVDRLDIFGAGRALNMGETVTVIQTHAGGVTNNGLTGTTTGSQGAGLDYTYTLAVGAGNTNVEARVSNISVKPTAKAIRQAGIAQIALNNQASDLMLKEILPSLQPGQAQPFAAVDFGKLEYETGSYNDVKGVTLMAGLANGKQTTWGNFSYGAFVEAGRGNYGSYGVYAFTPIRASGDTDFVGIGGLLKLDWGNRGYVEASIKAGKSKSDYSSHDLVAGYNAKYKSSSTYYGGHVGLGYAMQVGVSSTMDMSGRYLWTRVGTDNVDILGDRYQFDAVTSSRARVGFRLVHTFQNHLGQSTSPGRYKPYIGLHYDHEFDGKTGGQVYRYELGRLDTGGGTVMGEIGLSYQGRGRLDNIFLDVGVQGYTGKREGVTGSVRVNWLF